MTVEDSAGIWKLHGAKLSLPNGSSVLPYGEKPNGLVIFDADAALLSVHIYSAVRPLAAASSPQEITPDKATSILKGSVGYFGKIEMAGDR
jgi:Lipocalin-like domain